MHNDQNPRYVMRLCLVLFCLAAAGSVDAQTTQSTVRRDTMYTVGEVIVTATRRAGTTLEVPLAVSILDRKEILRARAFGLDEALSGVPGVLAQSRYGTQDVRLTIRGFGARGAGQRSNAGTSRGIRVMIDGIPETEPDGRTSFDLIDLASAGRVEIIRSNSSSLWGNAAGGIINITSNTGFDAPYASVATTFGSFGFARENVQAGALLGSGRFFFTMSNTTFDGWRAHSRSFSTIANAGIEAALGERTRLGVYLAAGTNSFRIPGPLTRAQFNANPAQAQDDPASYSPTFVQRDERRFNRLGRIGVTAAHDFDDASGVSVMVYANPKYLQRSERNTFRDFTRYHIGGSAQYSHTARIGDDMVNVLQVGTDGALQDGAILFYSLVNKERGVLQTDKNEGASTAGVFVQNETVFSDRVSLILGGRYDAVTYSYRANYDSDPAAKLLSERKTFSRFTPKGGITYRITPTHSVYASLGGGLEVPAGNETDPPGTFGQDSVYAINPLLDASVSTTAELGTKQVIAVSDGFLRAVAYDVALYWVQVKNDFIPYRGGRFYFTAGETRRLGLEAGATAQFRDGVTLQGAVTLSRNRYVHYTIDSVHYGNPGRFADLKDNAVPGIPAVFYSFKARYAPRWACGAYVEAGISGVGEYFADDYNLVVVPAYTMTSASVGCEETALFGERLTVRGFIGVQNLGNVRYAASAWINPDLSTAREPIYLEPGLPRNVIVSLGVQWKF
jgi:iron complex outermembrane receptor protein